MGRQDYTARKMFTQRRKLHSRLFKHVKGPSYERDTGMPPYSSHNENVFPENAIYNVVFYGFCLIYPMMEAGVDDLMYDLQSHLEQTVGDVYQIEELLHKLIEKSVPSALGYYRAKRQKEDYSGSLKPLSAVGKHAFDMAKGINVSIQRPEVKADDMRCAVAFMLKEGLRLAEKLGYSAAQLEEFNRLPGSVMHGDKLPSQLATSAAAATSAAVPRPKGKRPRKIGSRQRYETLGSLD